MVAYHIHSISYRPQVLALNRRLMYWRIFMLSDEKPTTDGEHWTGFAWDGHFVIKSVRFQHSKFSKVTKIIYNSISDACLVIFAPNLAIESIEFVQTWQLLTSSIMADGTWFLTAVYTRAKVQNGRKVQLHFLSWFMNLTYIFQKGRGGGVIGEGR